MASVNRVLRAYCKQVVKIGYTVEQAKQMARDVRDMYLLETAAESDEMEIE